MNTEEQEQRARELIQQGKFQDAELIYRTLVALGTNNCVSYSNLAALLWKTGRYREMIDLLEKSLAINPRYSKAHLNLGLAFQAEGDLKAAITSYSKAIEFEPKYAAAYSNLGSAYVEVGSFDFAIDAYNKAIELNPNHEEAHVNLAQVLLLLGHYERGWKEYEWRLKAGNKRVLSFGNLKSLIDSRLSEKRKKITVFSEQGLGDSLQFLRYVPCLFEKGLDVSLCVQTKLHDLVKVSRIHSNPMDPSVVNNVPSDELIPLLSLPKILNISKKNPLTTSAYISTDDQLISKWRGILVKDKRPIIAINWQGNPKHEKAYSRGRSLPLETFSILAKQTSIRLLSLQKGFGSEQLINCSFRDRFVSCQEEISQTWDFLNTAAIIANCDLVITCDTAMAHLSGGMGRTTWTLLKNVPDWRWGNDSQMVFWYPSMRLFRQRKNGDWPEVMQRVSESLREKFTLNLLS